jgi:hypothetical protein
LRRADIIGGFILLALGLLMLFVIIPAEAEGDTWSGVSPLFFPTLIAAGFCLACVGMLAQAIFRPGSYEGMEPPVKLWRMGFFALACIIVLGAVFAIHAFGFLWGGPLLVGALILFMGETRWHRNDGSRIGEKLDGARSQIHSRQYRNNSHRPHNHRHECFRIEGLSNTKRQDAWSLCLHLERND